LIRHLIVLLQQAVAEGWKGAAHMKKHDDLKALLSRDVFQRGSPNWSSRHLSRLPRRTK
jgi:hypothetical protein